MARGGHSATKRAIVLLVLCLTALGQCCAIAAEHEQHSANEHCCLLCHTVPLASLDAAVPTFTAPVDSVTWISTAPESTSPHEVPVSSSSSRAPPRDSRS